jgi:hypothetical protein
MPLSIYCDPAEVRAALGVNHLELSDETVSLPVYEIGLVRELNKVSTAASAPVTLAASFSLIRDKVQASRTEAEQALFESVRLFSVYQVASMVGVSLANFAPKSVSDGKASVTRNSGETFEAVTANIKEALARARAELISALDGFISGVPALPEAAAPVLLMASKRGYDPVVGS